MNGNKFNISNNYLHFDKKKYILNKKIRDSKYSNENNKYYDESSFSELLNDNPKIQYFQIPSEIFRKK